MSSSADESGETGEIVDLTSQPVPLEVMLRDATGARLDPDEAFLLVVAGENVGRMYPLTDKTIRIGRSVHADIRLDQAAVSQWHAKIVPHREFHKISDLGSTNGICVNGIYIDGEMTLRPGDVIGVGDNVLAYVNGQGEGMERTHTIPRALPAPAATGVMTYPTATPLLPKSGGGLPGLPALPEQGESLVEKLAKGLQFLQEHRKMLVTSTVSAAGLGLLSLLVFHPKAQSFFEITLKADASENPVEQRTAKPIPSFFQRPDKTFMSDELVKKSLVTLGYPADEEKVKAAKARLKFEGVALNSYRGEYTARTAERAQRFLGTHLDLFLEHEIGKTITRIQAEVDFLRQQLAENEKELSETEAKLEAFKKENVMGLPEHAENQLASRFDLSLRRDELQAKLERASGELQLARRELRTGDILIEGRVAEAKPYQEEVVEVRRQLERQRAQGHSDMHPDVQRLNAQLASLEGLSKGVVSSKTTDIERRANPAHRALRAQIAQLQVEVRTTRSELSRVNSQLSKLDSLATRLPEVEATFAELTRSYAANKELHDKLFAKLKASQLELERASAAARYDITVKPTSVGPSLVKVVPMRLAMGACAGLAVAIALALLIDLGRKVMAAFRQNVQDRAVAQG